MLGRDVPLGEQRLAGRPLRRAVAVRIGTMIASVRKLNAFRGTTGHRRAVNGLTVFLDRSTESPSGLTGRAAEVEAEPNPSASAFTNSCTSCRFPPLCLR